MTKCFMCLSELWDWVCAEEQECHGGEWHHPVGHVSIAHSCFTRGIGFSLKGKIELSHWESSECKSKQSFIPVHISFTWFACLCIVHFFSPPRESHLFCQVSSAVILQGVYRYLFGLRSLLYFLVVGGKINM